MSENTGLPPGWIELPLDAVLEPLDDGRTLHHGWSPQCEMEPSHSDDQWGVLKTTAVQDGQFLPEHNKRLPDDLTPRAKLEVRADDLLITCAGPRARCGVACLVRDTRPRLILSGKMYRFRVKRDLLDGRYMEAYLRSPIVQVRIDEMKTGISDSGLNLTHDRFRQLKVRVAPLLEQRRIVAKIEELFSDLDAGVAALERVKANLKRYRAAVLKAAVEGKLTAEWRCQNPATEPADKLLVRILDERRNKWEEEQLRKHAEKGKTPPRGWRDRYMQPAIPLPSLPPLPKGWAWATVEQLSTKVVDGVHKKPDYVPEGVPFVTVRNLTAGPGISFDRINYITRRDHEEFIKRANPEKGDILISKDGTLGVTRVIRTDTVFSIFVSVAMIKPVRYDSSEYIGLALSSPPVQRQMVPKGSGLQHIHLEDLREDAVPLPPFNEQQLVVAEVERRLSVADAIEMDIEHGLKRAARLRQAILKRAFEGKLVPQDPRETADSCGPFRATEQKVTPPRQPRAKRPRQIAGTLTKR